METSQSLDMIREQLAILTRIASLLLVQQGERLSDRIDLLHRAGLQPKAIAELLETTPNTVSVQVSRRRAVSRQKGRFASASQKGSHTGLMRKQHTEEEQ